LRFSNRRKDNFLTFLVVSNLLQLDANISKMWTDENRFCRALERCYFLKFGAVYSKRTFGVQSSFSHTWSYIPLLGSRRRVEHTLSETFASRFFSEPHSFSEENVPHGVTALNFSLIRNECKICQVAIILSSLGLILSNRHDFFLSNPTLI